jgi:Tol biopolymer transport system component
MANRLRSLLIGSGILLLVVALVGLLVYSPNFQDLYAAANGDSSSDVGVQKGAGDIAFVMDSDIYTMNSDGSDLKQLTDTEEFEGATIEEHDPAWSPDHEQIAFSRTHYEHSGSSASPEPVSGIYVMDANGSGERKLAGSNAAYPTWSPDGNEIAFSRERDDGSGSSLYVMDADSSGEPTMLTSEAPGTRDTNPAWSPDGEKIAFESNRGDGRKLNNYNDIYVMKACCPEGAANPPQRLTDTQGWNRDPAWSPDGTRIAFTYVHFASPHLPYGQHAVRNTDIYTMQSDGSGETRLTHTYSNKHPEHNPAWSPSGSEVALVRSQGYYPGTPGTPQGTSAAIYVMKSNGSGLKAERAFRDAVLEGLAWR